MTTHSIYGIQLDIAWEDKTENFSRVRSLLEFYRPYPGSLVVLPEMFATGFSMNLNVTRQGPERADESFLAEMARKYAVTMVGGVVSEGPAGKGSNESVVISPTGQLLARYAKIHPLSLAGEAECHEPGAEIVTFEWGGFVVAPFICYDLRFPEIFRAAARRGATLFVVIACWPTKRRQHWITLLQARAIENQAYVVGVNRTGDEPKHSYSGWSVVIDPQGVIIADAGERQQILNAVLDPEVVASWRKEFPALRDAHWREQR
jgi:predicted amidohydrolase